MQDSSMALAAEAPAALDGVVGKKQLCAILRWSRMKLDRRLDADPEFPVKTRGNQGGGWEFDVAAVTAYLGADVEPEEHDGEDDDPRPSKLLHAGEETARQRLNRAQAEWQEDKLRQRRGELVEAEPLKLSLAEAVGKVSTGLNALPDILVRRLILPETAGLIIRQEVDQLRRALVVGLREVLTDG